MSATNRRKLDVPYKVGDDYFLDSKLNLPFYRVPLYRELEVIWVEESELPTYPHCIVGIFRKIGIYPDGVFNYKLDIEESKINYRPNCRGNE